MQRASAIGEHVENVDVFLFKRAKIKVGVERDKDGVYDDKNKVMRILPLDEAAGTSRRQAGTEAGCGRQPAANRSLDQPPPVRLPGTRGSPVFELRPYQRQALDALDAYWRERAAAIRCSLSPRQPASLC